MTANYPYFYRDQILVEVTNYCNIRCNFCSNAGLSYPKGMMPFELFQKIVDEVAEYPRVKVINLLGMGEPFIHPDIFRMIDYIDSKGVDGYACTNANWSAQPNDLLSVLKLKHIHISVDALTNDVFQLSRPNTDVNRVIATVSDLIKLKRETGSPTPHIQVRMNVFTFNKHQVNELVEFFRDLGADSVWIARGAAPVEFQTLLDVEQLAALPQDYVYLSGFPQDDWTSRFKDEYADLNSWRTRSGKRSIMDKIGCNPLTVRWDGSVSACCFDYEVEARLGDLKYESFAAICGEQRIRQMGQMIVEGHDERMRCNMPIVCDRCEQLHDYIRNQRQRQRYESIMALKQGYAEDILQEIRLHKENRV